MMTEEPKRKYKWPRFALAAVVLFILITVVWVAWMAHRVEQQADFNAPLPASTPYHSPLPGANLLQHYDNALTNAPTP